MSELAGMLALFTVPPLLCGTPARQQGLYLGLFVVLLFLSAAKPPLALVPLGIAGVLFLRQKPWDAPAPDPAQLHNPAHTGVVAFAVAMTIFCGFRGAVFSYSTLLSDSPQLLQLARQTAGYAVLAGPLLFGIQCDRQGPFRAAMQLVLLGESALLLLGIAQWLPVLLLPGSMLFYLTASGLFTVLPVLAMTFLGHAAFLRRYPPLSAVFLCTEVTAHALASQSAATAAHAGQLLLLLPLSLCLAALALRSGWRSRFLLLPGRSRAG